MILIFSDSCTDLFIPVLSGSDMTFMVACLTSAISQSSVIHLCIRFISYGFVYYSRTFFFITTRLAAATAAAAAAATTYTAATSAAATSAAATSTNARYVCFLVDKQFYKMDIMCRSFLSF